MGKHPLQFVLITAASVTFRESFSEQLLALTFWREQRVKATFVSVYTDRVKEQGR